MTISKEKVHAIAKKYGSTIINDDDAENAFRFVWDILVAEADALREKEPYAFVTINEVEHSAYCVNDLMDDISEAMEGF